MKRKWIRNMLILICIFIVLILIILPPSTGKTKVFLDLDAPLKGFYTFENSAHSPLFEEPERAMDILVNDVLNERVYMSDVE